MRFKSFYVEKDILKGGKGDSMKISDVDPLTMKIGIAIEREHTDNPKISSEIVRDHMAEGDPNYYKKLLKFVEPNEISSIAKKAGITTKELIRYINEI